MAAVPAVLAWVALIAQADTPPTAAEVSKVYRRGLKLYDAGRAADALPHLERAVKLALRAPGPELGPNGGTTADLHNVLGKAYWKTSQFALAEDQFRRAVKAREYRRGVLLKQAEAYRQWADRERAKAIDYLSNLGIQYWDQGRHGEAEKLLRRALAEQRAVAPGGKAEADSADNLALFLWDARRKHAEAETLFRLSLKIRTGVLGPGHPETAQSLRNMAEVRQRAGDLKAAREFFTDSMAIWEKHKEYGPGHRKVAISLQSLAKLELAAGRPADAVKLLRRAVAIQKGNAQSDDPEVSVGSIQDDLAAAYAAQGEWGDAVRAMDESLRAFLRYVSLSLPAQPEADQLTFLATSFKPAFDDGLSLALRADAPGVADLSAGWVLNGKGVSHGALAGRAGLEGDELAAVRERRARLTRAGGPGAVSRLAELAAREQTIIREAGAGRGRVKWGGTVPLKKVRAAIPAGAVLIEVARFRRRSAERDEYAAWLVPPAGRGAVRVVGLGPAGAIDNAVWDVRQALRAAPREIRRVGEGRAAAAALVPLQRLSGLVLRPLIGHVGDARRWLISPDADLWLVPWAALPLPDGRYAAEAHEVTTLISGRALADDPSAAPAGEPVVVAAPDYEAGGGERAGEVWPALPGSAAEADAAVPALAKWAGVKPRVLTDKSATETALKAVRRPRALLVSTHGFFREDRPTAAAVGARGMVLHRPAGVRPRRRPVGAAENPLLRCGLALAGANWVAPESARDDGVLTGLEIVGLDLRGTELVVLSACETGVGRVHSGEGVAGLRQAFLIAGARSVAATLWQVADRETAELIGDFFARLGREGRPAAALRSAQAAMIRKRRAATGAAHPYYWAAFTVTGG